MNKNTKIVIIVVSIVIGMAILIPLVIGGVFFIKNQISGTGVSTEGNNNNNWSIGKKDDKDMKEEVKIRESETKQIKLTKFDNGLFSLNIPEGWKVDVFGDYIHYTIKVYNPKNPMYQMFFNMKTEGYNKSQAAKKWQQTYYPNNIFAKCAVIEDKTTEGFYKIFNELGTLNNTSAFTFPTLTDFTVVQKLGTSALGGDVLRATFKDSNGKEGEGLFTAYVYDPGPYYVTENITSGNQIDIYYLNVYNTIFVTAPKNELIDWEDTLNKMVASLEFSNTFISQYQSQQDSVMKTFQSVRNICNQITDSIMSAWEARSASYDIMSQKQSDAILGYERVYDTEKGDIYKAYNGFTDDYSGERYKAISDDMYTKATSGYIEK